MNNFFKMLLERDEFYIILIWLCLLGSMLAEVYLAK